MVENADFLLMDETQGRSLAIQLGVPVKGTLGVLEEASQAQMIDLPEAVNALRATGIFLSESLIQKVLEKFPRGRG
ncbi:MAG: DUF3368 domain-containing protein [Akkermansiaceae bacterium]|nr:DUF3368 domain-containing protein [Verrucomicrobiales bacterium]